MVKPKFSNKKNKSSNTVKCISISMLMLALYYIIILTTWEDIGNDGNDGNSNNKQHLKTKNDAAPQKFAPMGKIAYGTKSHGEHTAERVRDAILNGFRQVVTSSHHVDHNETGVGYGWKMAVEESSSHNEESSSIDRSDLFLQTMFVPCGSPNYKAGPSDHNAAAKDDGSSTSTPTISEQVKITIESSLSNLQTTYIDAVLFHNFRAKLEPYDQMLSAWRALEPYVDAGVIRHLGISNCHDHDYLTKLIQDARVMPTIVQNRFHANREFDVNMRPLFKEHNIQSQTFWVLNGNGNGNKNSDMAKEKGLTPAALMYAFVMSLGSTPLIGTKSLEHMKEDVAVARRYEGTNGIKSLLLLRTNMTLFFVMSMVMILIERHTRRKLV